MIIRIVRFSVRSDMLDVYRTDVADRVLQVNRSFKCADVYLLAKGGNSEEFGIISVWPDRATLDSMRSSDEYKDLLTQLNEVITGPMSDEIWMSV